MISKKTQKKLRRKYKRTQRGGALKVLTKDEIQSLKINIKDILTQYLDLYKADKDQYWLSVLILLSRQRDFIVDVNTCNNICRKLIRAFNIETSVKAFKSTNIDKKLIREIAKLNNDISPEILDDFIDNKLPELVIFLNTHVFFKKHINLIYQPIGDIIGISKRGSEIAKSLRSKSAEEARLAEELAKLLAVEDTPSEYDMLKAQDDMLKAQLLEIKSELIRLRDLAKKSNTSGEEIEIYMAQARKLRDEGKEIELKIKEIELKIKEIEEESFKEVEEELASKQPSSNA
jgi:hypothetical protein